MVDAAIRQRHAALCDQIKHHNYLYYTLSTHEITDFEYDELFKELIRLENENPELATLDSPSQTVGSQTLDKFQKIEHAIPMLSIDTKTPSKLISEIRKSFIHYKNTIPEIVAEPKIDGLSCSIRYENRKLVRGATRGDGFVGEDITQNVMTISEIPKTLPPDSPSVLEVRGEVYMKTHDFESIRQKQREKGERPFESARNAAAGSLRQLDPKITAERPLHFAAYALGETSESIATTQWEARKKLKSWGIPITKPAALLSSEAKLVSYYERIKKYRDKLNFSLDGVVFKVNSFDLQGRIGTTARAPGWAAAQKFPPEQHETVLERITISVGRTGTLTPVAELKPVKFREATISNATLHNQDEIECKDFREGDTVIVQRAGDVIPQVVSVVIEKRALHCKPYIFPKHCPECGSKAVRSEREAATKCSGGLTCPAQALERLKHFVSRDAFNIEGLGEKNIELFFNKGLIKTPADIFKLERLLSEDTLWGNNYDFEPLSKWDGWGKVSARKLFEAINARRHISINRFIYAIGIPQIGENTAKLLSEHYITIDNFINSLKKAQNKATDEFNILKNINGIGETIVEELVCFINEDHNINALSDLLSLISIESYESKKTFTSIFSGKTVVFTGTLSNKSRKAAKIEAERLGAKIASEVSSKTDFLIAGTDPGSKLKRAQEMNIKILTETEWDEITKEILYGKN
ncbi:MAG: NAD-dependent DNA ligase LigA [Desulfuromonas sp.]|nr:NAD-dependent DNA ligase LigA [Desulfuromonas sp.]